MKILEYGSPEVCHAAKSLIRERQPFSISISGKDAESLGGHVHSGEIDLIPLLTLPRLQAIHGIVSFAQIKGSHVRVVVDKAATTIIVEPPLGEAPPFSVPVASLDPAELAAKLPKQHMATMLDEHDSVRNNCIFFLLESKIEIQDLIQCNLLLRSRKYDPWPPFLVAFASNGCGDYWAYDTREGWGPVVYIDPDRTVQENTEDQESMRFPSFDEWHRSKSDETRSH